MDMFAQRLQMKLNGSKPAEQLAHDLLNGVEEVFAEIRHIEMMKSHYQMDAQKLVQSSAHEVDLAIRLRSVGAAVKDQEFVHDLDQSLNRLNAAKQKISAALGS